MPDILVTIPGWLGLLWQFAWIATLFTLSGIGIVAVILVYMGDDE